MTEKETRQIIIPYFEANKNFEHHKKGCMLRLNGNSYQIKPDDAFYYADKVLLFEYENNKRPVESISKYFWLFENTNWLTNNIKIKLLLTINKEKLGKDGIRTQSIKILGNILSQLYQDKFDFHFLNYDELTEENLLAELETMTATN